MLQQRLARLRWLQLTVQERGLDVIAVELRDGDTDGLVREPSSSESFGGFRAAGFKVNAELSERVGRNHPRRNAASRADDRADDTGPLQQLAAGESMRVPPLARPLRLRGRRPAPGPGSCWAAAGSPSCSSMPRLLALSRCLLRHCRLPAVALRQDRRGKRDEVRRFPRVSARDAAAPAAPR